MAYATVDEYHAWIGTDRTVPTDIARILDRASEEVDGYVTASYDTDGNDDPSDTDVAAAFRDATCAVAEYWHAIGEDVAIAPIDGPVSFDRLSYERPPDPYARRALEILRKAGLRGEPGYSVGTTSERRFDV